jgi:hypothetical protein
MSLLSSSSSHHSLYFDDSCWVCLVKEFVMMEQGLFVYVGSEVYEFATDAKKREGLPSD